jgi:hypothetical protein
MAGFIIGTSWQGYGPMFEEQEEEEECFNEQ